MSGRTVPFSLWPVIKGQGGYRLNPPLFASSPWPVMRQAVAQLCKSEARIAATAFLEQAEDFFSASGRADAAAAKPLLLYYSFLNLAKALILVRSQGAVLNKASHGLSEQLPTGGKELADAYLDAYPNNATPQVFDLLLTNVRGTGLYQKLPLKVPLLLRQVVTGHRLLATCDKSCGERFVAVNAFELLHDAAGSEMWLRWSLPKSDLTRIGITQTKLIKESQLESLGRAVASPDGTDDRVWFEHASIAYKPTWIADTVPAVLEKVRHQLWQTVLAVPPYRAYYLFCAPLAEHPQVLPQLLSAYALMYYFGSITRYRPHHFDRILAGEFGAFVATFLHEQPKQMLFLFASEFMRRDVAKPALV